jgi:4,5-dihydroxyphthalate decarboxylase
MLWTGPRELAHSAGFREGDTAMNLKLSIGLTSNPRTWPILDGTVKPDGIDLVISLVPPSELFWRQLRFGDFDASEMSYSSLLMAIARGDERWVGLPVFTTRYFFQTWAQIRRDAGIKSPGDLKGKRVGVPEYQQTAALWSRGILQHDFGVRPQDMEFWMERTPERSHAGAMNFQAPPGVTIHQIPPEKNIGSMMVSGELHATLMSFPGHGIIDRTTVDLAHHPDIAPLFEDPIAEGMRFLKKSGFYPINHGMILRRSIAQQEPWVVLNLFKAFAEANAIANRQRMQHIEYHLASGLVPPEYRKVLETPLVQHGIKFNRKMLETGAQYSHEQGLTARVMKLEEVFHPATLDQ